MTDLGKVMQSFNDLDEARRSRDGYAKQYSNSQFYIYDDNRKIYI